MIRLVLLHAAEDAVLAENFARRSRKEFDVRRPALDSTIWRVLADEIPRAERVVVLLSRWSIRSPQFLQVVSWVAEHYEEHLFPFQSDPGLDLRMVPAHIGHRSICAPHGDVIADLRQRLRQELRPQPPRGSSTPRGESNATWGVAVAVLVSMAMVLVVAGGLVGAPWPWPLDVLASKSTRLEPTTELDSQFDRTLDRERWWADPPAVLSIPSVTPAVPSRPRVATPVPVPDEPDAPTRAHLDVEDVEIRAGSTMRLRYLAGGSFLMGIAPRDGQAHATAPLHEATVSGFWLAETEVTVAQWRAIQRTTPNECEYGCDDDHPVANVSWVDTLIFLNRLSERHGYSPCFTQHGRDWEWEAGCSGYRLPTEAEWEYAVRAGSSTRFHYGDGYRRICEYDNVADLSAATLRGWPIIRCNDGHPGLAPVGSLVANPWFLFDMHGNVSEWVWDRYGPYPSYSQIDYRGVERGVEPGTRPSRHRVVRGGSFMRRPQGAYSAHRESVRPGRRLGRVGFRVARSYVDPLREDT